MSRSQVMEDGQSTRLLRTPKEGERILAPTRRPDGTLRKPIRIRPGYTPQDEVAIYQSKGALMRKAAEVLVPPGYDPSMDVKLKTKSAKRNERKKEKRLQATLATPDKGKNIDSEEVEGRITEEASVAHVLDSVDLVTEGINNLSFSLPMEKLDSSNAGDCSGADIDRRIRALKKKIRLAKGEGEERTEKLAKIEAWHEELKLLEGKRSNQIS